MNMINLAKETEEKQVYCSSRANKRGGWKTLPLILGNELCSGIAVIGLSANMIVYLTTEFNVNNILATHIINISNGGNNLSPLVGAFLADSWLGRFWAISLGSVLTFLAAILIMLTAIITSWRPPACNKLHNKCQGPSKGQLAIVYTYYTLLVTASGGARYNSSAFGADQFDKSTAKGRKQIESFFNWYYVMLSLSIIVASTVIVYVQDNVGWSWGFGVCVILAGVCTISFFMGINLYVRLSPEGSPFTGFVQVIVSSIRKRDLKLPSNVEDYCYEGTKPGLVQLTQQLRFLNKAAIKRAQDFEGEGFGSRKPWRECTVEEVEDLKSIIKTLPIWACGIILGAATAQQNTSGVLQALTMNRHLISHNNFQVPAASFIVFAMLASATCLVIYEKMFIGWARRKGVTITQLQRIGLGIVMYMLAMAVAAVVETKRLRTHAVMMSAFWLVPQYALIGLGEALHGVGLLEFFYDQFPSKLRSMATASVRLAEPWDTI